MASGTGVSGRKLVERLAAHLAFLLNAEAGGVVEVKPFALFNQILALLAGRGAAGGVYRDGVLAFALSAADRSADEVALAYFDRVIDRGMFLARDNHTHITHELFGLLCRRGVVEGWPGVTLARGGAAPVVAAPVDFGAVAERLQRYEQLVSPGNPAATTRAKHGPLILRARNAEVEVQEELSTWRAIKASPSRQTVLAERAEFDRLCSIVIKAIEAANAHYGALVRLGAAPLDWMGALSLNTAKELSAFVSDLKSANAGQLGDLEAWKRGWAKRKVPGFKTVEELWESEIGRYLRRPVVAKVGQLGTIEHASDEAIELIGTEPEDDLLDESVAAILVNEALEEEAITDFDAWLFLQVCHGKSLAELTKDARWARGPGGDGHSLADYVDGLRARLLAWARRRQASDED